MTKRVYLILILTVLSLIDQGWSQTFPEGFFIENIAPSATFDTPDGIAIAADGRIFVAEKGGRVQVVDEGISSQFIDLSLEVFSKAGRGLLGIALDPGFTINGYVYLLYSVDHDSSGDSTRFDVFGRLVRYTVSSSDRNVADLSSRLVLIGVNYADGIPACYISHSPGSLRFAIDGTLMISNGDAASFVEVDPGGLYPDCFGPPEKFDLVEDVGAFRAQFLGSYAGKILRIDAATGLGLPSNPFYTGNPADVESKIWAYGFRNPFRFSLRNNGGSNPNDGNPGSLFIGDVGWGTWEEINICTSGGENFGWPCKEGPNPLSGYRDATPAHSGCSTIGSVVSPVAYWHHLNSDLSLPQGLLGKSIIMGPIYEGTQYPIEYRNKLFYADFIEGWMAFAEIDEHDNFISQTVFSSDVGRVVDIIYDPVSEYIYYVKISDNAVYRLGYSGATEVSREDDDSGLDTNVLLQNFPNPFNPSTAIRYALNRATSVTLKVYNLLGQEMATLVNGYQTPGFKSVVWDGIDHAGEPLPSGVYIYKITAGNFAKSYKMILIR